MAVVVGEGDRLEAVAYGVVRTPAHTPITERLILLYDELRCIIHTHAPEQAAVVGYTRVFEGLPRAPGRAGVAITEAAASHYVFAGLTSWREVFALGED